MSRLPSYQVVQPFAPSPPSSVTTTAGEAIAPNTPVYLVAYNPAQLKQIVTALQASFAKQQQFGSAYQSSWYSDPTAAVVPPRQPPQNRQTSLPTVSSDASSEAMEKNITILLRMMPVEGAILAAIKQSEIEDASSLATYLGSNPARVMKLCTEAKGHILWQLIETLGALRCSGFISVVCENVVALSNKQFGCIAVNRVLAAAERVNCSRIREALLDQFEGIADNMFGNFVAKEAVLYASPEDVTHIALRNNYVLQLATNKFGGHVVEQMLDTLPFINGVQITQALIMSHPSAEPLRALAYHRFANFVLQHAINMVARNTKVPENAEMATELLLQLRNTLSAHVLGRCPHRVNFKKAFAGKMGSKDKIAQQVEADHEHHSETQIQQEQSAD